LNPNQKSWLSNLNNAIQMGKCVMLEGI